MALLLLDNSRAGSFLLFLRTSGINSLLNRPLHSLVRDKEGHTPVEDLAAGAAGGVEDSGAEGAGQGVLTVLGEAVVDNALLGEGA